jgi:hypothetical protein
MGERPQRHQTSYVLVDGARIMVDEPQYHWREPMECELST